MTSCLSQFLKAFLQTKCIILVLQSDSLALRTCDFCQHYLNSAIIVPSYMTCLISAVLNFYTYFGGLEFMSAFFLVLLKIELVFYKIILTAFSVLSRNSGERCCLCNYGHTMVSACHLIVL